MPIRAVVLDLDGTLIQDGTHSLQPGVSDMIARLESLGVRVYVASNRPRRPLVERAVGLPSDRFLYASGVGGKKGTGRFVDTVCHSLGIGQNDLLYLGDTKNDMTESVNRRVLFFRANWSDPTYPYGIPVPDPPVFAHVVETYFLKDHLWYYTVDDVDTVGRPVMARALLEVDVSKRTGIHGLVKGLSTGGSVGGPYSLQGHLTLHLLASIYLEGLHLSSVGSPPLWCVYPGHTGATAPVLGQFVEIATSQFRESYKQGMIFRHTPAVKSAIARYRREHVPLSNQLQTIHLDPAMRGKLDGRTVIVVDDFTTHSHSFETARNFLMNAGAERVIGVAVGKYPRRYQCYIPRPGVAWDSFSPAPLEDADFTVSYPRDSTDPQALSYYGP